MKNLLKIITISFILLLSSCSQDSSVWIPGWKEATSLIESRVGAAVVVADGYIFMIGGVDGKKFLKTTEYAKIQKDGSLGPWKPGALLNEERGFADAIFYNGSIYVAGGANGQNGRNLLGSVERARISSDGTITQWTREKSSMGLPRRCSKLVVKNNRIYAVGGFGGSMLDTIVSAEILSDGNLGEWVIEKETMFVPHYVNGVKEKKGVVYVVGGHARKRGGGIADVELSRIKDTGGLQPWKRTSPLNVARYGLSTAVYGDYLYALGGIDGAKYSEVVEKTEIASNGELTEWHSTTSLSQPRTNFSTAVFKDWIYILGGSYSDKYLTSVEYATANDIGDIGFWGSKEDEVAYTEKLKAFSESAIKAQLPNEGVVKKILRTDMYSYLQVSMKDRVVWLAAPKMDLNVNSRIRFSEGALMSNFYSKSLDHTFPSILFVSEVEKAETK